MSEYKKRSTPIELLERLEEVKWQLDEAIEDEHQASKRVQELTDEFDDIRHELADMGVES